MKRAWVVLFLVFAAWGWSLGFADGPDWRARPDFLEARREFIELKAVWLTERENYRFSSRTSDYWQGPAGQGIMAMGKRALPFIMDELAKGEFLFNVPAREITGISAPGGSEYLNEQALALNWVDWWRVNKGDPRWNIYVNP